MQLHADDGRCLVQPVLKKGATSGRASATEVGGAAYTLLHRCVIDKGVGGIAGDIGGDGNLNVAIAKYSPNVRCDRGSTPGPRTSSLALSPLSARLDCRLTCPL